MTRIQLYKYSHSVIDATRWIVENITGSRDDTSDDDIDILADWLRLRITEQWHPSEQSLVRSYDDQVRMLAVEALDVHERWKMQCEEEANGETK